VDYCFALSEIDEKKIRYMALLTTNTIYLVLGTEIAQMDIAMFMIQEKCSGMEKYIGA